MIAGAIAGAAIGAAIVGATAATGGLAMVAIVGGCVAGGGLSGGALVRGVVTALDLPDPTTGIVSSIGSPNVLINGLPALRAGMDMAACSGLMGSNHYPIPTALVAEGAQTVLVNGLPMGRVSAKLICGGSVKSGSPNVVVGGPTAVVAPIFDSESIFETGLQALGFAAFGAGGVMAAVAGGALALGQFAAVAGVFAVGFEKLHDWGDSLGPGWGDILTGVAGFGLMLGGARAAKRPAAAAADEAAAGGRPVRDLLNTKLGETRVERFLEAKRADPKLDALLTDEEYLALRGYTSSLYKDINPALRQGTPGEWQPMSDAASSGLQKMSANGYANEGAVVRRANFTDEQVHQLFPENGLHTDKAFVSTSTSTKPGFGNSQINIQSKKGVDVSSLSEYRGEEEVLFKPGTSFKVDSKSYDSEAGGWIINLIEI
jgi:uncharacterized Zn-binding protein involved in type VI secretion